MVGTFLRRILLPVLVALPLAGCGSAAYVRPGQPVGLPGSFGPDEVVSRVFLVGDAGALGGVRQVMPHVLARLDERSYTVFLGDNIYDWDERDAILGAQLEAASRGRGALFISGNHDWDEGFEGLEWQAEAVHAAGGEWLPEPGCPGPAVKELPGLRVVALDSEWWFQEPGNRPERDCADGGAALEALASELARPGDPVLVVAHHPMESFGKHGGNFPWYQHLLPPVFGTIYVWARQAGAWPQDLGAGIYSEWIEGMETALAPHPPLLVAHGHEHTLQMLAGGRLAETAGVETRAPYSTLVSGSGSKTSWVGHGERTLFSSGDRGFAVVTVLGSGAVALEVFHLDEGGGCVRGWDGWLVGSPAPAGLAEP